MSIYIHVARRFKVSSQEAKGDDLRECECGHRWTQHTRTANGAFACKYHGCNCRDVVPPGDVRNRPRTTPMISPGQEDVTCLEQKLQRLYRHHGLWAWAQSSHHAAPASRSVGPPSSESGRLWALLSVYGVSAMMNHKETRRYVSGHLHGEPHVADFYVILGNVGTVYSGDSESDAETIASGYVALSQAGYGRGAGESVTMLRDGEIVFEYDP